VPTRVRDAATPARLGPNHVFAIQASHTCTKWFVNVGSQLRAHSLTSKMLEQFGEGAT
jgi:hypothetical protein